MKTPKHVVITTGGTAEPIDDVRRITNTSTGKLGYEISRALSDLGYLVEAITAEASMLLPEIPGVTRIPFTSTVSLRERIFERDNPDIVIMAAAVSDYAPIPIEGKISSDQETLTIHCVKTPKILPTLREKFGPDAFIVGFKLLSGVSRQELIRVAQKQLADCHLNLTVANDLSSITGDQHPVIVITPEGGTIDMTGTKAEVAVQLAEFIDKRASARRFQDVPTHTVTINRPDPILAGYATVLETAKALNLFTDKSGHVSVVNDDDTLWISPRQVDKSTMKNLDAVLIELDDTKVYYEGRVLPSSDAGVIAALSIHPRSKSAAYLHFHNGWGRMNHQTQFPYPCGTIEEYIEIASNTLEVWSRPTYGISVELIHHGFLLGFPDIDTVARLKKAWRETHAEFVEHATTALNQTNKTLFDGRFDRRKFRPIWSGITIAGLIYGDPERATVYLTPYARHKGLGKIVTKQLIDRQYTIRTLDACAVADYYKKAGFTARIEADGFTYLAPPV